MLDFGKLKNDSNCSCIFRNSIASHTKLRNFVRHFYNRLRKATVVVQAQMLKFLAKTMYSSCISTQV